MARSSQLMRLSAYARPDSELVTQTTHGGIGRWLWVGGALCQLHWGKVRMGAMRMGAMHALKPRAPRVCPLQ
jgi:hypothetical protein